jgi:Domain of unknown function (DUF5668)
MNGYRRCRTCSCARCRCSGYLGPLILVTLGVLFLIDQYTMYSIGRTWPLLLIVIGVVRLLQWNAPTTGHVDLFSGGPGAPPPNGPTPGGGPEAPSGGQQVTHG